MINNEKYELSSQLYNYWQKNVLQNHLPFEDNCYCLARRCFQTSLALLGIGARVPAMNVAVKFGGTNQSYGWSLAVINVISYGSLIAWGFIKMLNEEMKTLTSEEKELSKTGNAHIHVAAKATLAGLGIFSQSPFAYMAYEYNNKSIPLAIFIVVADASLPIYSLNLSTKALIKAVKKRKFSVESREIQQAKEGLIFFLKEHRKALAKEAKSGSQILNSTSLASQRLIQATDQTHSRPAWQKIARGTLTLVGSLTTLIRLTVYSAMSYEGAKLLFSGETFDNHPHVQEGLCIGTAALVFLSNAYLMKDVIINSLTSKFQYIVDRCSGQHQDEITTILRPKLKAFSSFLTLGLSAMSYSTPLQIAKDLFHEEYVILGQKIYGIQTLMQVGSTMAVFLMVSNSLDSFMNELIEMSIIKYGSDEHKELIEMDHRLKRFIEVVENSSLVEFAKFICLCQRRAEEKNKDDLEKLNSFVDYLDLNLDQWSNNLTLTRSKITQYIQSIEPMV